jgi:DNA polymerase III subunit epsilon
VTRYVVFDVETTGLSVARGDRVIEIGAVFLEAGCPVNEFSSLICVDHPIHWAAQKVHGISDAMLCDAPSPHHVWPLFADFIAGTTLLAHNAKFDLSFLRHEFSRAGLALYNPHQCTLEVSRRHFPNLPNHRLETVARHLLGNISPECSLHRALGDARLLAKVWLKIQEKMLDKH